MTTNPTLQADAEQLATNLWGTKSWDKSAIFFITEALQSAFNAGCDAMREAAARESEDWTDRSAADTINGDVASGYYRASKWIAEEIRALPLPPYGEKK